jgi:hypothetical protein
MRCDKRISGRIKSRCIAVCLLLLLSIGTHASNKENSKTTAPISSVHLNYRITVGEKPAETTEIVMAVGKVTTLYIPDQWLNWHCGYRELIEYNQSDQRASQNAIFLRPRIEFATTNFVLELPNGNISFLIRAINPTGGAKPGQYHGEVIIKSPSYVNELKQLSNKVAELDKKLNVAIEHKLLAEKRADEAIKQSERAKAEGLTKGRIEGARTLERVVPDLKKGKSIEVEKLKVSQLGQSVRTPSGFYLIFEMQNRASSPKKLEQVEVEQGRAYLGSEEVRALMKGERNVVGVYIEGMKVIPRAVVFTVDGKQVSVPVIR